MDAWRQSRVAGRAAPEQYSQPGSHTRPHPPSAPQVAPDTSRGKKKKQALKENNHSRFGVCVAVSRATRDITAPAAVTTSTFVGDSSAARATNTTTTTTTATAAATAAAYTHVEVQCQRERSRTSQPRKYW